MKSERRSTLRRAGLLCAVLLVGCVGPTGQPEPLESRSALPRGRLLLDGLYVAGVGGVEYALPGGTYRAEARDSRGVYYRAPGSIGKRGDTAGLFPGEDGTVEGGVFVPDSGLEQWAVGVWLYLIEEDGTLYTTRLPGDFAYSEGSYWRRVPSVDAEEPGP